ncbi:MAG: hypothetical protein CSA03_02555 [Bacteroidetes bacterium]|nr:MAG: hypothetical protein CSA03_02555 [Bacteroidota bacterium]
MVQLDADKIVDTIKVLKLRINDRFPDSGLEEVCQQFLDISRKSKKNAQWIAKPNLAIRISSYAAIAIAVLGIIYTISFVDFSIRDNTLVNIMTLLEALINDVVLLGAAIFFLVTIEVRVKRKRALERLNELRVIAHVIDMHQLTKDPNVIGRSNLDTRHSPKRILTKYELERYLDYCSELMSLISKVAILYAQSLPDEVIVHAVNEVEELTSGLSRKIYQKLMILDRMNGGDALKTDS